MAISSDPEAHPIQHQALKEGVDYYIEHRYWVFTEYYLRKRGWCCGSGCRHCPYGHQTGSTTPCQTTTPGELSSENHA